MSRRYNRSLTVAAAVAGLSIAIGGGSAAVAATHPATPAASSATAATTLYQAKITNRNIVLGPQSAPTLLAQTPALPAGVYQVTAIVGTVLASHDQIVCAASVAGNDGVFGTAGNAGTGSIYGTATMADAIRVTAGQRIGVTCNSFNYGLGTYATEAVVEALPVGVTTTAS